MRSGSEGLSQAAFQQASRYNLSNMLPHFLSPLAPKSLPPLKPETKQHLAAEAAHPGVVVQVRPAPSGFCVCRQSPAASVLSSRRERSRRPGAMVGGALEEAAVVRGTTEWPERRAGRMEGKPSWRLLLIGLSAFHG